MNRLIEKSFSIGPGKRGQVVMLKDALALLNEESSKRMTAEEKVTELQIELAEARADLERIADSWGHIFPRFRRMRAYIKTHCGRDYERIVGDEQEQDDGRRAG